MVRRVGEQPLAVQNLASGKKLAKPKYRVYSMRVTPILVVKGGRIRA